MNKNEDLEKSPLHAAPATQPAPTCLDNDYRCVADALVSKYGIDSPIAFRIAVDALNRVLDDIPVDTHRFPDYTDDDAYSAACHLAKSGIINENEIALYATICKDAYHISDMICTTIR